MKVLNIACCECGKENDGIRKLETHILLDHQNSKAYKCILCEYVYVPSEYTLLQHCFTAHQMDHVEVQVVVDVEKRKQLNDWMRKSLAKWAGITTVCDTKPATPVAVLSKPEPSVSLETPGCVVRPQPKSSVDAKERETEVKGEEAGPAGDSPVAAAQIATPTPTIPTVVSGTVRKAAMKSIRPISIDANKNSLPVPVCPTEDINRSPECAVPLAKECVSPVTKPPPVYSEPSPSSTSANDTTLPYTGLNNATVDTSLNNVDANLNQDLNTSSLNKKQPANPQKRAVDCVKPPPKQSAKQQRLSESDSPTNDVHTTSPVENTTSSDILSQSSVEAKTMETASPITEATPPSAVAADEEQRRVDEMCDMPPQEMIADWAANIDSQSTSTPERQRPISRAGGKRNSCRKFETVVGAFPKDASAVSKASISKEKLNATCGDLRTLLKHENARKKLPSPILQDDIVARKDKPTTVTTETSDAPTSVTQAEPHLHSGAESESASGASETLPILTSQSISHEDEQQLSTSKGHESSVDNETTDTVVQQEPISIRYSSGDASTQGSPPSTAQIPSAPPSTPMVKPQMNLNEAIETSYAAAKQHPEVWSEFAWQLLNRTVDESDLKAIKGCHIKLGVNAVSPVQTLPQLNAVVPPAVFKVILLTMREQEVRTNGRPFDTRQAFRQAPAIVQRSIMLAGRLKERITQMNVTRNRHRSVSGQRCHQMTPTMAQTKMVLG